MIYDIYVHAHKLMCPFTSFVAKDFQKMCWSNSTPSVRTLVSNGLNDLVAQDCPAYHCFLVSDYVFLEKCFGESDAGKLLERFSTGHILNVRSMVKKLSSLLAPVIQRPKSFILQTCVNLLKREY